MQGLPPLVQGVYLEYEQSKKASKIPQAALALTARVSLQDLFAAALPSPTQVAR